MYVLVCKYVHRSWPAGPLKTLLLNFPTVYDDTVVSGGKTFLLLICKVEAENGKQEKKAAEYLKKIFFFFKKAALSPLFSEELTLRGNQKCQTIALILQAHGIEWPSVSCSFFFFFF